MQDSPAQGGLDQVMTTSSKNPVLQVPVHDAAVGTGIQVIE